LIALATVKPPMPLSKIPIGCSAFNIFCPFVRLLVI